MHESRDVPHCAIFALVPLWEGVRQVAPGVTSLS